MRRALMGLAAVVILLGSPATARAQDISALAGVNLLSDLVQSGASSAAEGAKRTRFIGGVSFSKPLSDKLAVVIQGLYSQKGKRIQGLISEQEIGDLDVDLTYLDVPILAGIKAGPHATILAGVVAGVLLDDTETIYFPTLPTIVSPDNEKFYKKGLNLSLAFGAQIHAGRALVQVVYNLGLSNLSDEPPGSDYSLKTRTLSVMAGVNLFRK